MRGGKQSPDAVAWRRIGPPRLPDKLPVAPPLASNELLPLRVSCQRLGIGKKAWAALARRGFLMIRAGKPGFFDVGGDPREAAEQGGNADE